MNATEIIITIISSSLLSAALTAIVNWNLHNSNYKKEYYKKILDKRLEAFEIIQEIAGKLSFRTQLDDYVIPAICFDNKYFENFVFLLASGVNTSFWLDHSTSNKITELNVFLLNNISNHIDPTWSDDRKIEEYHKLGNLHSEEIRNFRRDLQGLINNELKNLHNVNKFFSNNRKKTPATFPVYQSKYQQ